MRRSITALIAALVLVTTVAFPALADKPSSFDANGNATSLVADAGFNQFGYNYTARIFSGPADGVDKILDGKVWGDPTYANDLLVMKWNAEWDRGYAEGWAYPPYAATLTNEWNGLVPGGSGWTEHVKIVWIGNCGADGVRLADGGYCIWGQFEVIMDQGLDPTAGHVWYALATPNGFGVAR